jgi:hypothetical protein
MGKIEQTSHTVKILLACLFKPMRLKFYLTAANVAVVFPQVAIDLSL